MTREIRARESNTKYIVLGVCVVAFICFLGFSQQKHATHSGDGVGVPRFANGGSYRDGTRSMNFNSNNPNAYGCKSEGFFGGFEKLALLFLVLGIILYVAGGCAGGDHVCNGGCCKV
ncbi:second triple-gene-block protein [Burdock mottle virus]|uniref:Second triple-gene-block protein n=1 Tax=Burdock mottle virus TaxID=1324959 RepID=S6BF03_9VIRU|nr:second triple-gene-block protein [Burdock mottle virus]BAN62707.1 second triple-gene-block protein [Burdock mottle virus]